MQSLVIVLDAVMVGGADSAFLQQAAHLTGGIYQRLARPSALLQYLLVGAPSVSVHNALQWRLAWSSAPCLTGMEAGMDAIVRLQGDCVSFTARPSLLEA